MQTIRAMLVAMVALAPAVVGAEPTRSIPAPNIHFRNEQGQVERGVRCAVAPVPKREKAILAAQLDLFRAFASASSVPRTIPVVFHVVSSPKGSKTEGDVSDADIAAQMDGLNAAYAGSGFSFDLLRINRVKNSSWFTGCYSYATESKMKQALAVDPAQVLNVYTCKPTNGILGFAYLPWSIAEDHYLHGIVVLYSTLPGGSAVPYDEGDTATHEVGHYLGLLHTFEGGCVEPGDQVADTPAEAEAAFDCPVGRDTCPSAGEDPIHNFMDYTDDACMFELTVDQGTRMLDLVALYKPSLRCGDGSCEPEEACICASDCGAPPATESICNNGLDDDCDTLVDSADPNCASGCTLGQPGASCTANAQCCSNSCKGPRGKMTCR